MYRNFEVGFIAAFGLALIDSQHASVNVLTSHSHDVAAALAGVQQEREGEPLAIATGLMLGALYMAISWRLIAAGPAPAAAAA